MTAMLALWGEAAELTDEPDPHEPDRLIWVPCFLDADTDQKVLLGLNPNEAERLGGLLCDLAPQARLHLADAAVGLPQAPVSNVVHLYTEQVPEDGERA